MSLSYNRTATLHGFTTYLQMKPLTRLVLYSCPSVCDDPVLLFVLTPRYPTKEQQRRELHWARALQVQGRGERARQCTATSTQPQWVFLNGGDRGVSAGCKVRVRRPVEHLPGAASAQATGHRPQGGQQPPLTTGTSTNPEDRTGGNSVPRLPVSTDE